MNKKWHCCFCKILSLNKICSQFVQQTNICSRLTEWLEPSDQTSSLIARNIFGWPTNLINIGSQWSPWLELCKSILHKSTYMDFGLASQIQSINNSNVRIFVMSFIAFFCMTPKELKNWCGALVPNQISITCWSFLTAWHRWVNTCTTFHWNVFRLSSPYFISNFREFCSLSFTLLAKQNLLKRYEFSTIYIMHEVHSSISIENKIAISTMR